MLTWILIRSREYDDLQENEDMAGHSGLHTTGYPVQVQGTHLDMAKHCLCWPCRVFLNERIVAS